MMFNSESLRIRGADENGDRSDYSTRINAEVAELQRRGLTVGSWEQGSGRPARDGEDGYFGRRVEADRSWTVHDVFTGASADVDGIAMTGLSRRDATNKMLSLNQRSVVKKREHNALLRSPSTIDRIVSR